MAKGAGASQNERGEGRALASRSEGTSSAAHPNNYPVAAPPGTSATTGAALSSADATTPTSPSGNRRRRRGSMERLSMVGSSIRLGLTGSSNNSNNRNSKQSRRSSLKMAMRQSVREQALPSMDVELSSSARVQDQRRRRNSILSNSSSSNSRSKSRSRMANRSAPAGSTRRKTMGEESLRSAGSATNNSRRRSTMGEGSSRSMESLKNSSITNRRRQHSQTKPAMGTARKEKQNLSQDVINVNQKASATKLKGTKKVQSTREEKVTAPSSSSKFDPQKWERRVSLQVEMTKDDKQSVCLNGDDPLSSAIAVVSPSPGLTEVQAAPLTNEQHVDETSPAADTSNLVADSPNSLSLPKRIRSSTDLKKNGSTKNSSTAGSSSNNTPARDKRASMPGLSPMTSGSSSEKPNKTDTIPSRPQRTMTIGSYKSSGNSMNNKRASMPALSPMTPALSSNKNNQDKTMTAEKTSQTTENAIEKGSNGNSANNKCASISALLPPETASSSSSSSSDNSRKADETLTKERQAAHRVSNRRRVTRQRSSSLSDLRVGLETRRRRRQKEENAAMDDKAVDSENNGEGSLSKKSNAFFNMVSHSSDAVRRIEARKKEMQARRSSKQYVNRLILPGMQLDDDDDGNDDNNFIFEDKDAGEGTDDQCTREEKENEHPLRDETATEALSKIDKSTSSDASADLRTPNSAITTLSVTGTPQPTRKHPTRNLQKAVSLQNFRTETISGNDSVAQSLFSPVSSSTPQPTRKHPTRKLQKAVSLRNFGADKSAGNVDNSFFISLATPQPTGNYQKRGFQKAASLRNFESGTISERFEEAAFNPTPEPTKKHPTRRLQKEGSLRNLGRDVTSSSIAIFSEPQPTRKKPSRRLQKEGSLRSLGSGVSLASTRSAPLPFSPMAPSSEPHPTRKHPTRRLQKANSLMSLGSGISLESTFRTPLQFSPMVPSSELQPTRKKPARRLQKEGSLRSLGSGISLASSMSAPLPFSPMTPSGEPHPTRKHPTRRLQKAGSLRNLGSGISIGSAPLGSAPLGSAPLGGALLPFSPMARSSEPQPTRKHPTRKLQKAVSLRNFEPSSKPQPTRIHPTRRLQKTVSLGKFTKGTEQIVENEEKQQSIMEIVITMAATSEPTKTRPARRFSSLRKVEEGSYNSRTPVIKNDAKHATAKSEKEKVAAPKRAFVFDDFYLDDPRSKLDATTVESAVQKLQEKVNSLKQTLKETWQAEEKEVAKHKTKCHDEKESFTEKMKEAKQRVISPNTMPSSRRSNTDLSKVVTQKKTMVSSLQFDNARLRKQNKTLKVNLFDMHQKTVRLEKATQSALINLQEMEDIHIKLECDKNEVLHKSSSAWHQACDALSAKEDKYNEYVELEKRTRKLYDDTTDRIIGVVKEGSGGSELAKLIARQFPPLESTRKAKIANCQEAPHEWG